MQILVLGLPRTGTQSLADALAILGIAPVYHMRDVGKNKHQDLWVEAIEAKFEGKGTAWTRDEFDRILSGYEAVADYPAAIFPEELIAAYPEASIILTTRTADSWLASMTTTLWHHHVNQPADDPGPLATLRRKYHAHCWGNDLPAHGRRFFGEHNERARKAAEVAVAESKAAGEGHAERKFLELPVGAGWEPLCQFLGVPVPEVSYPRSDDWFEYKKEVAKREEASAESASPK
ncbi:unnamed protein product [Parascedosporium putredinis]|uniref:P-loop containing nucleoside triphosphate hydrolase protein n=1 Tax=Parascedosporium putredinis TaxID=1442378 RepID=A0A9P1M878_9PEZI|nr:unnamed protein product [Parascedosporium putredinis]CAI7989370.1 unnamed protein product [Parascedosporium putredinis]